MLGAFVPLPAELLVSGVLLPERVQQLHHLRLSQQLLLHGTPGWTWRVRRQTEVRQKAGGVTFQDISLFLTGSSCNSLIHQLCLVHAFASSKRNYCNSFSFVLISLHWLLDRARSDFRILLLTQNSNLSPQAQHSELLQK